MDAGNVEGLVRVQTIGHSDDVHVKAAGKHLGVKVIASSPGYLFV